MTRTVLETITEILPGLPAGAVRPDRSLRDLGADSVDRVEIITLLLERTRCTGRLADFAAVPDVGALIDRLSREETR